MHQLLTSTLLRTSLLAAVLAAGCTDDGPAGAFVGTWAYSTGMFAIDCNGQQMQFPLGATTTETFVIGDARDLSKTDNAGCTGITFDVTGEVASLAPAPQSCTITSMGTSTADAYTFTLGDDGETLASHSTGTFVPMGAPDACTFVGGGTLIRQ